MGNSEKNKAAYWDKRYNAIDQYEASGTLGYGEVHNYLMRTLMVRKLDRVLRKLNISTKNKCLFDVGCGVGLWFDYWNKKNLQSFTGIDLSQFAIDILTKKYQHSNFILGDICDDKFHMIFDENRELDIITAFEVLLLIQGKEKLKIGLNNIAEMLKRGGYLIIIESILTRKNNSALKFDQPLHTLSEYKKLLANYNLHCIGVYPIFFLMVSPLNSESIENVILKRIILFLWNKISFRIIHSKNVKYKYGKNVYSFVLFVIDHILSNILKEGLSMRIMVFQKNNC